MRTRCAVWMVAAAVCGLLGCDDILPDNSGWKPPLRLEGAWRGTMDATELKGFPLTDGSPIPLTLIFSSEGKASRNMGGLVEIEYISFLVKVVGNKGAQEFAGGFDQALAIWFGGTVQGYRQDFMGQIDSSGNSMSGTWEVKTEQVKGTWQARRE